MGEGWIFFKISKRDFTFIIEMRDGSGIGVKLITKLYKPSQDKYTWKQNENEL